MVKQLKRYDVQLVPDEVVVHCSLLLPSFILFSIMDNHSLDPVVAEIYLEFDLGVGFEPFSNSASNSFWKPFDRVDVIEKHLADDMSTDPNFFPNQFFCFFLKPLH